MFKADAVGKYPIHVAVSSGSLECFRILLEHETVSMRSNHGEEDLTGVSFMDRHLINLPDKEGETALHLAVNSGDSKMIDVSFLPISAMSTWIMSNIFLVCTSSA